MVDVVNTGRSPRPVFVSHVNFFLTDVGQRKLRDNRNGCYVMLHFLKTQTMMS